MRVPEQLPRIGVTSALVVRNPLFDPRHHRGLSPGHYELWNRIGPQATVANLIEGASHPESSISYLEQLLVLGALELKPADANHPEPAPTDDLDPLTAKEQELYDQKCALSVQERRSILRAARLVARGDYLGLLNISRTSTKRELKRAYFELSKEFHPDRYYDRDVGAFGPVLSRIFETASSVVHGMASNSSGPCANRRRVSDRYPIALRATIACTSWRAPGDGVVRNVSDRGVFVATSRPASVGDRVRVVLATTSGRSFELAGRIAFYRSPEQSTAAKLPSGLGIELFEVDAPGRPLFDALLRSARLNMPRPAPASTDEAPATTTDPAPRLARGTGSHDSPASIVGIDFGTTNTCVSVSMNGRVSLARWSAEELMIPSVVAFPQRGHTLVGREARDRLAGDPTHAVASCKRLLGIPASDHRVQAISGRAAFPTGVAPDGALTVKMWGDEYAPPQLASLLLGAARQAAERVLNIPIGTAVLTVPVSFTAEQVDSLRRAARLAGLDVADVIDEPSAAALANREHPDFGGLVGVYDFGGGTFDFSVIDASAGDFRVLGTAGDSWLGGDDFDQAIADAVANQLWAAQGIDLRKRAVEWQQLLFATERAKRALSTGESTTLLMPDALRTPTGTRELRVKLSRPTAERLWAPLIDRSLKTAQRALRRAGTEGKSLTSVYLSGGTSTIPAVRAAIETHFRVPVRIGVPAEHAACLGAGLHASQLHHGRPAPLRAR